MIKKERYKFKGENGGRLGQSRPECLKGEAVTPTVRALEAEPRETEAGMVTGPALS